MYAPLLRDRSKGNRDPCRLLGLCVRRRLISVAVQQSCASHVDTFCYPRRSVVSYCSRAALVLPLVRPLALPLSRTATPSEALTKHEAGTVRPVRRESIALHHLASPGKAVRCVAVAKWGRTRCRSSVLMRVPSPLSPASRHRSSTERRRNHQ